MYKKILVILPHPDDEVFPMSGSLAKYIEEGSKVTYVCLTLGEMGRNLGNPAFANRVTLPSIREKELKKSCSIIGIEDLRMWGYHDKTIEFEPYEPLDRRILGIVDEIKPDLILTFYPGYGVHPDHNACGAAVIRSLKTLKAEERPLVHCVAFPDEMFRKADIKIDVTDYIEKKIGALKSHSSQFRIPELEGELDEEAKAFMKRISREQFWYYDWES